MRAGRRAVVLHLITTLDRGGAEKALHALAAEMQGSGRSDVHVAYLKGRGELTPDFERAGVRVHPLGLEGLRGAGAYARARRLVRELRPDVVHTHLFKADTLGAAVLGRRRPGRIRPVLVSTKHNEDAYLASRHWRAVAARVARRCDALVAITPGVARFVRDRLGDAMPRLEVIPYGVPAPTDEPPPPRGRDVLCVARFEPQKDHATLLEAMPLVTAEIPARLVLLGRGPLEAQLRERAARRPESHVEFAGFAEDPTPWYDAAEMVVLPSRWEGLGLALVEAALRARPVVATRVGGVPDVVEHGVTGWLVPPGDPLSLADGMLRYLRDPELARRTGEAARSRALERFSLARCAADTERLYAELRGGAGA